MNGKPVGGTEAARLTAEIWLRAWHGECRAMVGPRLTLDLKSNGQDWLCGNGGKCKVKGALVFSSSNLVNAPAVPWGGAGWGGTD